MSGLELLRALLAVGERSNEELLTAAADLDGAALDQAFEMGRGTLRRTLLHILVGEEVWLERMRGNVEHAWRDDLAPIAISELRTGFERCAVERGRFIDGLNPTDLSRRQRYRDSRGSLFEASLGDMLLQAANHSIHHRAQAANMLRRLGVVAADMDYMMHVRKPVGG